MIIQTGNRTDIPAFYSDWFLNRIKEGFVMTRNPFNPGRITKYRLDPEVVDLLVFCTKNPSPLLERIDELERFRMFWFVTITPYSKDIEPNVPDKMNVLKDIRRLSEKLGKERVQLRYDPIIINEKYTLKRHVEAFEKITSFLEGYIDTVIISFVDLYEKVRINWPELKEVDPDLRFKISKIFAKTAEKRNILIKTCGEGEKYEKIQNVDCSGCMTKEVFERAVGRRLDIPKLPPSRKECSCLINADIGQYNTCMHLCRYCYANAERNLVINNHEQHDPTSPLLVGKVREGDIITESKQKSWINNQLMFDIF